jgi:hypothetical protein
MILRKVNLLVRVIELECHDLAVGDDAYARALFEAVRRARAKMHAPMRETVHAQRKEAIFHVAERTVEGLRVGNFLAALRGKRITPDL